MKMICGIYKLTNTVNGKVYIGQSTNVVRRKYGHFTNSYNPNSSEYDNYFHRAIRKYGKESFKFDVLEECPKHLLNEREIYWIDYYKSYKKEKGYNISLGGYTRVEREKPIYQIDIATKQIIKEYPSLYEASESVDGYAGALSQVCSGKLTSAYNYLWCYKEDYKERMYDNYKRKRQCRGVYAIDKINHSVVKKYDSIIEAEKDVNGKSSEIINVCIGNRKTAFGYIWCYADEYYDGKYDGYDLHVQRRGVKQIDINSNEVIAVYKSIKDALKEIGKTNKTMISHACNGRTRTAYGYRWEFIR